MMGNYCRDYKNWNHGCPDLILWNPETGEYLFSEIKSENDRLSDVQIAWLNFFTKNGISAESCYINRDMTQIELTQGRKPEDIQAEQIFTRDLNWLN